MGALYITDVYDHDIFTVKQYGEHMTKLSYLSAVRKPGYVAVGKDSSKKGSVNTEKLACNILRAKSKVREYGFCNDWDFFCTFTLSPEKYDRHNLQKFQKDFSEFLHNYNRRCKEDEKVAYLLVPEMHKDGSWHMHGLIKGIRQKDLYVNKYGYLTWKQYEDRFGFISMDKIKDHEKVVIYLTKYITKEMSGTVRELGAHLYYASKGLATSLELYRGKASFHGTWDWEHPEGYCKIKTFDDRKGEDISECLELI